MYGHLPHEHYGNIEERGGRDDGPLPAEGMHRLRGKAADE